MLSSAVKNVHICANSQRFGQIDKKILVATYNAVPGSLPRMFHNSSHPTTNDSIINIANNGNLYLYSNIKKKIFILNRCV